MASVKPDHPIPSNCYVDQHGAFQPVRFSHVMAVA